LELTPRLNRLCAYKMMEAREVYVGGQKFREAASSKDMKSTASTAARWRTHQKLPKMKVVIQ
jgi:hypothetical protein